MTLAEAPWQIDEDGHRLRRLAVSLGIEGAEVFEELLFFLQCPRREMLWPVGFDHLAPRAAMTGGGIRDASVQRAK